MSDVYEKRLQAFTGRELRPVTPGPDPVNVPMIRHWAEAMGDSNRVHLDDAAARAMRPPRRGRPRLDDPGMDHARLRRRHSRR